MMMQLMALLIIIAFSGMFKFDSDREESILILPHLHTLNLFRVVTPLFIILNKISVRGGRSLKKGGGVMNKSTGKCKDT